MPLLLADLIYSRDCKPNLRKNVDATYCADNPDVVHWSCSKLSLKLKTSAKGACSVFFSALLRNQDSTWIIRCCLCFQRENSSKEVFFS